MTKEQINAVLENVRSWPQEDQEELVEIAKSKRGGGGSMSSAMRSAWRSPRPAPVGLPRTKKLLRSGSATA
jgi:hypothetical protein